MAEDKEGSKDIDAKDGAEAKKGGGVMGMLTKLPVLVGGVMTVEAVVLFAVLKGFGGGPMVHALCCFVDKNQQCYQCYNAGRGAVGGRKLVEQTMW